MNRHAELRPPVFGVETEASVTFLGNYDPSKQLSNFIATFFPHDITPRFGESGFLGNGGRLYPDQQHPEYSTGECLILNPEQKIPGQGLMAEIRKGEILTERMLINALNPKPEQGPPIQGYCIRNGVIDEHGNTWGRHYNLLYRTKAMPLPIENNEVLPSHNLLALFLTTWTLLCGSGVTHNGHYYISQKALTLESTIDTTTTRNKPLIHYGRRAHADEKEYSRLHIVSGDAHISPWADLMAVGMADIVVRMIEAGVGIKNTPILENAHLRAKEVAADPSCTKELLLDNDKTITALDIQYKILEAAQKMCEDYGKRLDDDWVLNEWESALNDLKSNPSKLINRVDWALRRALLQRSLSREDLDLDALAHREVKTRNLALQKAAFLDQEFETIAIHDPEKGQPKNPPLGARLRKKQWAHLLPSDELLEEQLHLPSSPGRAALRHTLLMNSRMLGHHILRADWGEMSVQIGSSTKTARVRMLNPWDATIGNLPPELQLA